MYVIIKYMELHIYSNKTARLGVSCGRVSRQSLSAPRVPSKGGMRDYPSKGWRARSFSDAVQCTIMPIMPHAMLTRPTQVVSCRKSDGLKQSSPSHS